MEVATSTTPVTDRELLEAEKGLIRLLHAKRFPREWIERHAPEAMAQARTDFAVRLAAGRKDDTVNLLVVIGYRRALKLLTAQRSHPTTSIENVFHLSDESTPTPEEEAIDHDRQEQVMRAMGFLPERERELMALVYFEGMSVRAAGRRLGWGKSSVDRHHQAALERLKAMLDKSLLSPEIALPAFIAARHRSLGRVVRSWIEGAAETIRDGALLGGGRIGPLAESGNAAALSGAGRTAAGVCGAAVVACLAGAAGGVVGPGVGGLGIGKGTQLEAPSRVSHPQKAASVLGTDAEGAAPAAPSDSPSSTSRGGDQKTASSTSRPATTPARAVPERQERSAAAAPAATAKQTASEFGVGGSGSEDTGEGAASAAPTENTPLSSPPAQAARPSTGASGGGGSGSSEGSSSGSGSSSEFGM